MAARQNLRRSRRRRNPHASLFLPSLGLPFLPSASAQQFTDSPSPARTLQPTDSTSTTSLSATGTFASPSATGKDSTEFALISSSPSTTSLTTATAPLTTDNAPRLTPNPSPSTSPSSDTSDNTASDRRDALLNYYFIFLALFIILLVCGLWLMHRRRKAKKARFRESGTNALARDLESAGWSGNARRWMQGVAPWRIGADGQMNYSREEGLNELGEAPPPYKQPDGTLRRSPSGREIPAANVGTRTEEPSIPLRTLSRDESERPVKPPGYDESIRGSFIRPYGEGSRPASFSPSLGPPSPGLPSPSTESIVQRSDGLRR